MRHSIEFIALLLTCGNLFWAYSNYRSMKHANDMHEVAKSLRLTAVNELRKAFSKVRELAVEQEHKVCEACSRIVARHVTDDDGQTLCVNCAKERERAKAVPVG